MTTKNQTPISLRWASLVLLLVFCACHNYYMAKPIATADPARSAKSIDSLKLQNRYFVLRAGSSAYYIRNMVLSEDMQTIRCTLDTLSSSHKLHLVNGRRGKMQFKKINPDDLQVLNEVHLYTNAMAVPPLGEYTLNLNSISKIEVLQKDHNRTTSSYVVGAIGYTLGAIVVVGIIIAAVKSSCPFVSGYNNDQFALQGEIYGGAIYPQLARHDYLPLLLSPASDNTLQVKISNELKERQYTDMAELWVIDHDRNTRVIADVNGTLYSVLKPEAPLNAMLGKKDVTEAVRSANDSRVAYLDDTSKANAVNEILLQFRKPVNQNSGKLILTLKNSYFLDHLYGEMAKGLGTSYAAFVEGQRKKPAADLMRWVKDQRIPLTISVKTAKGWEMAGELNTIGPLANREVIVPLDLSASAGDKTEIRLSSGFMFWEIDAVAMDYSSGDHFSVQRENPISAFDELGRDVLTSLAADDGEYLAQPDIGNTATIRFAFKPATDSTHTQSFVFHSKGYYEHVREFTGKADIKFLQRFTHPDAFAVFGMEQYKLMRRESLAQLGSK